MGYKIDLTGQKYGGLTVVEYAYTKDRKSFWKCRCDCGNEVVVCAGNLRSGNTKSCGCKGIENRERLMQQFYDSHHRHGMAYSRIHKIWSHMKERCNNPNCKDYGLYGGRGIRVCDEWSGEDGFDQFLNWAEENGYREDLSIERIDVNGNYDPNNCRWADATEQANNRRTNRLVTIDGETKTLAQWCKIYSMNYFKAVYRLNTYKDAKRTFDIL